MVLLTVEEQAFSAIPSPTLTVPLLSELHLLSGRSKTSLGVPFYLTAGCTRKSANKESFKKKFRKWIDTEIAEIIRTKSQNYISKFITKF